ncbi:MAG TPA: proton-conducting transporter membrane subunit, partial [Niastella sp.]|nr:proton-conducting transporter membrane subunit [Niastella sp.]
MHLLPYIPLFPLTGFLVLAFLGRQMPKKAIAIIGAGTVSVSAILTIILALAFLQTPPAGGAYNQLVWSWFSVSNLSVDIGLRADALTLVFIFVITFVAALIHIYSAFFMWHDGDYARFFASMNLFVCSMLLLVMADNLVLMYLGWEGVGLCSYLLIGFWYEVPSNSRAANKAFLITRIGDTALLIGLFLLFKEFGTLNISGILHQAPGYFTVGNSNIVLITILLLAGGM